MSQNIFVEENSRPKFSHSAGKVVSNATQRDRFSLERGFIPVSIWLRILNGRQTFRSPIGCLPKKKQGMKEQVSNQVVFLSLQLNESRVSSGLFILFHFSLRFCQVLSMNRSAKDTVRSNQHEGSYLIACFFNKAKSWLLKIASASIL